MAPYWNAGAQPGYLSLLFTHWEGSELLVPRVPSFRVMGVAVGGWAQGPFQNPKSLEYAQVMHRDVGSGF